MTQSHRERAYLLRYDNAVPLVERPAAGAGFALRADRHRDGRTVARPASALPVFDWQRVRRWLWLVLAIALAGGFYLLQSSFAATTSVEIAKLENERDKLIRQNLQLTSDIADLAKPARVRDRAYAMGLIDTVKSIKLTVPASAMIPDTAASQNDPAEPPTVWDQIQAEFTRWIAQTAHP
ncbi:MAG: hypothetical protein HY259_02290 [Chloroflexi bacterium]|nr:hypothetical protein [Chloroflexota bacterium]